jgi:hypothetical protein
VTQLHHAGAEPGYQANVAAFPTTGATVALVGNGNAYDADFAAIIQAIYPVIADLILVPPTQSCDPQPEPTPPTTAPALAPLAVTPVVLTPRFTG